MLSNSAGIFSLFGLIAVMMNFQKLGDKAAGSGPIIWTVFGAIFLIIWIVNFQFSRASEFKQGIYDLMFGAYLVKHVPIEGEASTGFWAKLENMGNYGINSLLEEKQRKQVVNKKLPKKQQRKMKNHLMMLQRIRSLMMTLERTNRRPRLKRNLKQRLSLRNRSVCNESSK